MPKRWLAVTLFLFFVCGTGAAQFARTKPTRLRVSVMYADGGKVRDVTVELMDAVGGSSVTDRLITDQDGRVEFNTITGGHRIRVTGDSIQPYEAELDITPAENYHIENIRVRRRPGSGPNSSTSSTVPAIRLKIPEAARDEFERGSSAMTERQWAQAQQHFKAAVDIYPQYDLAYNGLGSARWELKDVEGARQAFSRAVELNDKFAGALRNLSRIMFLDRNYEKAASLLSESLKTEPGNAWALTKLSYAELQLHRFKEAAEHALRVHESPHEGLADVHMIAGYALQAQGQPKQAVAQFKLYLKENPKGLDAAHAKEALRRLGETRG